MVKKPFGKTGLELSALGFGAMRFPMLLKDDKNIVDDDLSVPLLHKAFELGVNYVDTALYYCESLSEVTVGKALKSWKGEKIYVSTKNPIETDSGADFMKRLETSLKKLDTDCIDLYFMWGISLDSFKNKILSKDVMEAALKAKEQGLFKHLCFSYHDKPENMKEIIDSGYFEGVMVQYNLLDRSNEENLIYAKEKGLGVVIMGPVGGGKLGAPSELIRGLLKEKPTSTAEMAMRFVLANPNVDIALSGMSTMTQVEENAQIAARLSHLTDAEITQIKKILEENKKLAELYCTSCDYCKPCPQEINIPHLFGIMNTHRVYELTEHAISLYNETMRGTAWTKSESPLKCTQCGVCEKKCPQKLPIIKQLKETHETLYRA